MKSIIGKSYVLKHQVCEKDLATNWGNDIPVLATPVLLWLSEIACMKLIESYIDNVSMCLGLSHNMNHLAPTPNSFEIELKATLESFDKNKFKFIVEGYDKKEKILFGYHTRAVVNKSTFLNKVMSKLENPEGENCE